MFPTGHYNFSTKPSNSSEVTISDVTGSAELLVPGRVTSTNHIPQGAMSMPIEPIFLKGSPHVVQVSVRANNFETIELDENCKEILNDKIHWIRALRLSDDCHNYNIQLRLLPSQRLSNILNKSVSMPKLILQTVRPIEAGQELLLWFSEDILAMLQMSFLTPANIQGQKKYVCTRCSTMYESPNPLKLHITLGCGRHTISSLWEKLANVLIEDTSTTKSNFNFKLSPDPQPNKQKTAIDLSIPHVASSRQSPNQENNENFSPASSNDNTIYRPFIDAHHHSSAFRPFQKTSPTITSSALNIPPYLPPNSNMVQMWPVNPISPELFMPAGQSPTSGQRYGDEAHIETLVSSLGKSKQGHICLYCGKCYSRKYGLKIHIRTHTGYKPLKCKYCLRPFGDPSNLNKHVRLHAEGDTPYKCDLCGKVLVRRRDLERHLKSRHMSEIHPVTSIEDDTITNDGSISEDDQLLSIDD